MNLAKLIDVSGEFVPLMKGDLTRVLRVDKQNGATFLTLSDGVTERNGPSTAIGQQQPIPQIKIDPFQE